VDLTIISFIEAQNEADEVEEISYASLILEEKYGGIYLGKHKA